MRDRLREVLPWVEQEALARNSALARASTRVFDERLSRRPRCGRIRKCAKQQCALEMLGEGDRVLDRMSREHVIDDRHEDAMRESPDRGTAHHAERDRRLDENFVCEALHERSQNSDARRDTEHDEAHVVVLRDGNGTTDGIVAHDNARRTATTARTRAPERLIEKLLRAPDRDLAEGHHTALGATEFGIDAHAKEERTAIFARQREARIDRILRSRRAIDDDENTFEEQRIISSAAEAAAPGRPARTRRRGSRGARRARATR